MPEAQQAQEQRGQGAEPQAPDSVSQPPSGTPKRLGELLVARKAIQPVGYGSRSSRRSSRVVAAGEG